MAVQLSDAERREPVHRTASEIRMMLAPGQHHSRADLHALLDACLDLAALSEAAPPDRHPGRAVDMNAHSTAQAVLQGAFGWAVPQMPGRAVTWEQLEADPLAWRQELMERLITTPHLLGRLASRLMDAFRDVDSDRDPSVPLLEPMREKGRGQNRRKAHQYERLLWVWIMWKKKREGVSIVKSVEKVAQATLVTTKTVEAWRLNWIRRDGKPDVESFIKALLELPVLKEFVELEDAGIHLEQLASQWRAAREPRKSGEAKSLNKTGNS